MTRTFNARLSEVPRPRCCSQARLNEFRVGGPPGLRAQPSEVEQWVDEGKRGVESAQRTKPMEVKEKYERQQRELQAHGEAMLGNEDEKCSSALSRD